MRKLLVAGACALAVFSSALSAAEQSVPLTRVDDARIDRWDPAMDAIVPKDWKIEKLAEGFGWAEGPIWVKSGGYLLFTDVPGNKMWKWSEKGGLEKFLDPSGAANPDKAIWREAGANGLAIYDKNSIVYADTGNRVIQRLDLKSKKKKALATNLDGKKFSSPNDVAKTKSGVLFFTDPPYGFQKGDAAAQKEISFNGVYRRGKDGKVTAIEMELKRPNGVALSPDERTLYVTQSEPTRAIVMAYQLDANANVTSHALFHDFTDLVGPGAPGLPDGLTVAADGTLFTSGPGGIIVLSKEGKRLGRISNGKATANCKFGEDGKTLFLTSHDTLARVRLNISGY